MPLHAHTILLGAPAGHFRWWEIRGCGCWYRDMKWRFSRLCSFYQVSACRRFVAAPFIIAAMKMSKWCRSMIRTRRQVYRHATIPLPRFAAHGQDDFMILILVARPCWWDTYYAMFIAPWNLPLRKAARKASLFRAVLHLRGFRPDD